MRIALLFTFISFSYATTCSQLKTMYSDLTCCANQNVDTCLRSIPLCADTTNGKICIDTNNDAIIKGGSSSYTLPTASTTELGGVKVDGSSIIIANGIISAPIGSSSSSTFSGNYDDLTNAPTLFSGDYNDLTNKPTIITSYNDLSDKPTIPTAFSGDYDDLTNKPTIPTAFSGDYNDLTNKPDLSNVGGGGGSSSGGVQKNGQLLDIVAGVADGRTVKGAEGDYTLEDVIAQQHISNSHPGAYDDVTGSKITYKPPANAVEVIYKFRYHMKYKADTATHEGQAVKLYIGGVECGSYKKTDNHAYGDTWVEFEWIIQIGTDDMPNGKISSWTDFKEIKVGMLERSSSHNAIIHGSHYGQDYGGSADDVIRPELEVRAIGLGGAGGGVAVDNSTIKQHANGTIYVANAPSGTSTAVVTRDGQVLEELVGVCDGSTVGSYTWPSVTAVQATTTTYTTLSGSEIAYTPPTGATEIIYSLTIAASTSATSGVFHVRLMVDGVESGASPTIGGAESRQYGTLETIRFVLDAWTGSKTLKLEVRHHSTGTTFQMNIHKRALVPAGATDATNELIKPILNIRAIGVQLNYINFDPTPTALISAQTFEVTQAECASTALRTSIHAQFSTAFPNYNGYSTGYFTNSFTTMPSGCVFYVDTNQMDYSSIFFNTDTSDQNDVLGAGHQTHSFTLRICKYANGDFVLLTDPEAKCKTIHYTLPDNLGALAGVLQTSTTNMGIGISPTAPLHVGTGKSTSISASRFECDGTGAIIEQNTGLVETVMTAGACSEQPNFQSSIPSVTATKHADALCKTGSTYQPYGFNYVTVKSGNSNTNKMTNFECREWARKMGYSFASANWQSDPNGCYYHNTDNKQAYYNAGATNNNCGASNYNCIRKLNVKALSSGTPPNDLTEAECRAYGESIGKWAGSNSFTQTTIQSGCFQHGLATHGNTNVYYNTHVHNVQCSESRLCLAKDTTYDNPGSTEQGRVDACRDACSNPSQAIFTGTRDFTPASFSVELTGGECTCHSEPSNTCQLENNNQVDLYALNNPPKGCFKDSSGKHYYNANDGGVCSDHFKCLRSDQGCLVQNNTAGVKKLSMIVEKSAWFKQEVVISSDRRIKENIVEVEGARERMRKISAKNYSYVDKRKYNGTTVGFIAQEVAEVMPEAVNVEKGFVPNILKRVKCTFARNITLNMTCPELGTGRVRLFVTDETGENLLDIDVKNGVMEVERVYTQVYAFGYEVDDFHTLEKSKLFALNFAATKELDKEVQLLRTQMNQLLSQR